MSYVRLFLSSVDPHDLPAVERIFNDDVRPALLSQPGCQSVELITNVQANAGGLVEGAALSRWESLEALEAAVGTRAVQESIVRVRSLLRQEPVTKTFHVHDS